MVFFDDTVSDATLVSTALDRPLSHYYEWSLKPDVATALSLFKSEREIRKTGRLDLVSWVQYVCAFGYTGPSDEAWAYLFEACRVLPMLSPHGETLKEHEIAVLLAFAKIKADNGDSMTAAQLIKHRIKPAVLGRTVARTPGILQHLQQKFETWALGSFTDMYFSTTVNSFGPSNYLPGTDELPDSLPDLGDCIRVCADTHANNMLKLWASLMCNILDIESDTTSRRAMRFEETLHAKRQFIYHHVFINISEYLFNQTNKPSFIATDEYVQPLLYRSKSLPVPVVGSTNGLDSPKSRYALSNLFCKLIKNVPHRPSFAQWSIVSSEVTIYELHAPGRDGRAGMKFVDIDEVKKGDLKMSSTNVSSSVPETAAHLRIASFNAPTLSITLPNAPASCKCRALRLQVDVGVVAPKKGSARPQLQIVDVKDATWVDLSAEEDDCRCIKGEHGSARSASQTDNGQSWYAKLGLSEHLQSGEGVEWSTYDVCDGMSRHEMKVRVGGEVLRRVRSGVEEDDLPADEAATPECFRDWCWIDCRSGAEISYATKEGVAVWGAKGGREGMFGECVAWTWRDGDSE